METDSLPTVEKKPPKLRWFQYRLRSLFILTTWSPSRAVGLP